MIATPRFVFLHLHKSGGTFVNACLLRFVAGARPIGYHLPRSAIPPGLGDLPVLGFVRNPWSYYVSWYAFQSSLPRANALFRVLSEDGRHDFKGTIANMVTLGSSPERLEQVAGALPGSYTQRGLNLPGFALRPMLGSSLGFYSFLFTYMFGPDTDDARIGRMETLRGDLPRLLEDLGQPVDDAFRAHVAGAPAENASPHRDYTEYYDAALRDLVAERDAALIARFGYAFGA